MNQFLRKEEEKPLNTCKTCKNQVCIKTQKICEKVEKLLPKITTGRHKKEANVSLDYLEILATERAFKLKYGKKYNIFKHENE